MGQFFSYGYPTLLYFLSNNYTRFTICAIKIGNINLCVTDFRICYKFHDTRNAPLKIWEHLETIETCIFIHQPPSESQSSGKRRRYSGSQWQLKKGNRPLSRRARFSAILSAKGFLDETRERRGMEREKNAFVITRLRDDQKEACGIYSEQARSRLPDRSFRSVAGTPTERRAILVLQTTPICWFVGHCFGTKLVHTWSWRWGKKRRESGMGQG